MNSPHYTSGKTVNWYNDLPVVLAESVKNFFFTQDVTMRTLDGNYFFYVRKRKIFYEVFMYIYYIKLHSIFLFNLYLIYYTRITYTQYNIIYLRAKLRTHKTQAEINFRLGHIKMNNFL